MVNQLKKVFSAEGWRIQPKSATEATVTLPDEYEGEVTQSGQLFTLTTNAPDLRDDVAETTGGVRSQRGEQYSVTWQTR